MLSMRLMSRAHSARRGSARTGAFATAIASFLGAAFIAVSRGTSYPGVVMSAAQMVRVLGGDGQNYRCLGTQDCAFSCKNTGTNQSQDSSDMNTYNVCVAFQSSTCHNNQQYLCSYKTYGANGCPSGQGTSHTSFPFGCT